MSAQFTNFHVLSCWSNPFICTLWTYSVGSELFLGHENIRSTEHEFWWSLTRWIQWKCKEKAICCISRKMARQSGGFIDSEGAPKARTPRKHGLKHGKWWNTADAASMEVRVKKCQNSTKSKRKPVQLPRRGRKSSEQSIVVREGPRSWMLGARMAAEKRRAGKK